MLEKKIENMDLKQIADSGQCFRWIELGDNKYKIPAFDRVLIVEQDGDRFKFDCTQQEFENVWKQYFDLELDYGKVIAQIPQNDEFLRNAADYGKGIRILRQDLWETIISFIISQNNNIPRIKKGIEALCSAAVCKERISDPKDKGSAFIPTAEEIIENVGRDSLGELGLGYRDQYIWDICNYIKENPDYERSLRSLDNEASMRELMSHRGIGKKVASCICLFSLHHLSACPIDVWVKRIIDEEYGGVYPEWIESEYAGIYQQYAFFYKRAISQK